MRGISGNKGGVISVSTLVWLLLIVLAVYFAVKFVPPYFTYYMLKGEVEEEAKTAHVNPDQTILKNIFDRIEEMELPVKEEDVLINRREGEIEIYIKYKMAVNFLNRYTKTLYFNIHIVKPIKGK